MTSIVYNKFYKHKYRCYRKCFISSDPKMVGRTRENYFCLPNSSTYYGYHHLYSWGAEGPSTPLISNHALPFIPHFFFIMVKNMSFHPFNHLTCTCLVNFFSTFFNTELAKFGGWAWEGVSHTFMLRILLAL